MATKEELLRQRGNVISSLKDKIAEDECLLKMFKALNDLDEQLEKAEDEVDEFDMIDSNHDGKISRKEWEEAGKDAEEFGELDSNGDDVISRAEWGKYYHSGKEDLKKAEENEEAAVKEALQALLEGHVSDDAISEIAEKYGLEVDYLEDLIYEIISDEEN